VKDIDCAVCARAGTGDYIGKAIIVGISSCQRRTQTL
jgi:hypothetical protein